MENNSKFTGTMLGYLGVSIVVGLICGITFGIALPWALCYQQSWIAKHTYVDGKQLKFDGTGLQLFGSYIKWFLLTFITLGIYGLWLPVKIQAWTASHTHFADAE
ncbi:MAG: DUF898 family protein [Clostridia bacterium]|nr:DUF898 family protein [Clostridia bacterium]